MYAHGLLSRVSPTFLDTAAWDNDLDISQADVLVQVLKSAGFDADRLLLEADKPAVKDALKANTSRAVQVGVCGVPSFQVNDGPVVWGQDKLDVVADMISGWQLDTNARL